MSGPLLVFTTFDNRVDAEKMSIRLLDKRLVACTQISGPVSSSYWWRGQIVSSEEYLLVMKSDEGLYSELEQVVHESHPYETPEIIATPITRLSDEYRQWMNRELRI